jgi:murein DD-endopeptidase MepM/ murein hydrolase activator NlpD
VKSSRRLTIYISVDSQQPPLVVSLHWPWVFLLGVILAALLAAAVLAASTYVKTMHRLKDYAGLADQVTVLRGQNERLQDLENELHEMLVFQERMLHLAGVERALRPDMELGDNKAGSFGPDSTTGSGLLLVWPVTGKRIPSREAGRAGVDIVALPGETVMASGSGRVVGVDKQNAGVRLRVAHGDSLLTVYGIVGESLVAVGDRVHAGQAIGRVGSGGTGGMLHFEVYRGGVAVPPEDFVRRLVPQ